jgi:hypothetical protein
MRSAVDRRTVLGAAAAAFMIVPRHVLGRGYIAPSDKITLAHIGCGTEGLREMAPLLSSPDIQIVAVCDPSKDPVAYVDWSRNGLRDNIRRLLGNSDWTAGSGDPIPGGREVARQLVEAYYAGNRGAENFRGVTTYADFRELLEKEKDVNAVKIMTPDHLHAAIAIAAMKKGKHVVVHKPIANRMHEVRKVMETARETRVATYFMPWESNGSMDQVMAWIRDGTIGALRQVHNWSTRPVWPQYLTLPTDRPPVPAGFDWDLWLGPALDRPYHPNYTHAVFRGWYDFGGGAMADMGHYSLWAVLKALNLEAPISAEAAPSSACQITDGTSIKIANDYSFPQACTVRFKFAAMESRPALDLFWYDGGMRTPTPDELEEDDRPLPSEGMLFVGDKGKILAGFQLSNPRLIPESRMRTVMGAAYAPPPQGGRGGLAGPGGRGGAAPSGGQVPTPRLSQGLTDWVAACRGGPSNAGNFLDAGPISETANLYAVALRTGGRKILYDSANMQITNVPEANKYLTREYRKGWEL